MRRPPTPVLAGLVLGLIGAGLVLGHVRGVEAEARTAGSDVEVFVAKGSIPAGTAGKVLKTAVERTSIPRRLAPADAVTDLKALSGLYSTEQLDEREPLRRSDFAKAGTTEGSLPIPQGKEAIAVSVPLDGGVARYPQPGDRVNVYVTMKQDQGTDRILSGVEVLATEARSAGSGDRMLGASTGAGTGVVYLLAVTPDEAGRLVHAKQLGSVWLTLLPEGQQAAPAEALR